MKKSVLALSLAVIFSSMTASAFASTSQREADINKQNRISEVERHLEPVYTNACFNEKGIFVNEISDDDVDSMVMASHSFARNLCVPITVLKASELGLQAVDALVKGDTPAPRDYERLSVVCNDLHTGKLVSEKEAKKPYVQCQYVILNGNFNPSISKPNLPIIK